MRCGRAVRDLVQEVTSKNLVVVTSRVAGWAEAPLDEAQVAELAPFDDAQVRTFLSQWCGLYAQDLRGPAARREGEAEGMRLANEVLGTSSIAQLARTPLLLTVLAVVNRAGLRLPQQRIELYDHALTVLVERWNQLRSAGAPGGVSPLRATDAQRLLGPVALEMVRSGERASIREERLRAHLTQALARGHLRELTSAEETIELFRRSIGLLVEQRPGWFGFLHLGFVEVFAARELVRTGALEQVVRDPDLAFAPEWREVLLLAAGELGFLRAEDERLEAMVEALVEAARGQRATPTPNVPSLLVGLLEDDPRLSERAAQRIVEELVPAWWFDADYGGHTRNVLYAATLQIRRMHQNARLRARIAEHHPTLRGLLARVFDRLGPVSVLQPLEIADWALGPGHNVLADAAARDDFEEFLKFFVVWVVRQHPECLIRSDALVWALRSGARYFEIGRAGEAPIVRRAPLPAASSEPWTLLYEAPDLSAVNIYGLQCRFSAE